MGRLISFLKSNRYYLLAFVSAAVGAWLGAQIVTSAWDSLHMEKWLPKSWTLAERATFRLFWIEPAGSLIGICVAGLLPTFLIIRQSLSDDAERQALAAHPEPDSEKQPD